MVEAFVVFRECAMLSIPSDRHGRVVPSQNPPKVLPQVDLLLPSEMISVVGFRTHACWCRKCKQVHYAPLDEATRRAGLVGPRFTGLIAYLKDACHCALFAVIHERENDTEKVFQSRLQKAWRLLAKNVRQESFSG